MAHLIGTVSLSKNVYSLYDIANFEHISKEKITELMQHCLKRTQNAAPDKSASGVQSFFNSIGSADSTINTFFTHTRLRPFAGAIRLELEKTYRNKKDIYYSMFCVPKDVYHKWKRNGKEYNHAACPQMDETKSADKIHTTRTIRLPKIPMLVQFESKLKKLDLKLSEGLFLAIQEYMTAHKDVFGDIATEYYKEEYVRENKMSLIQAYISPEVTNAVYKTLQRANMETIVKIKFSEFVEAALEEKLQRVPLKYSNPQLYQEMIELEKVEEDCLNGDVY